VFLALPHGVAAGRVDEFLGRGMTVVDLGPDFRLHEPADYPRWYRSSITRGPSSSVARGVRAAGAPPGRAGSPGHDRRRHRGAAGCYPTTTNLALAPLARAGLIGDLVVDAKSGVSGAAATRKAHLHFGEVNASVSAYGAFSHRHTAEIEQSWSACRRRRTRTPGPRAWTFLPT